jgi:hypothetical protein
VTIWTLGLSVLLLGFGGLAVDFWRALAVQRELAAVADSAVIAAASGIDEGRYRATGEVVVDPTRAAAIVSAYVGSQDVELAVFEVRTADDGASVSVLVEGNLELGLIGILVGDSEPLTVRAEATAEPLLVP